MAPAVESTILKSTVHETEEAPNLIPDQSRQNSVFKKILDKLFTFIKCTVTTTKECKVCLQDLPRASFHKGRCCKKGGHDADICIACLTTHVRTQMEYERWDNLTCPFCESHLRFRVIQAYLEPCLAYQYKLHLYALRRAWWDNFQWCLNPECHWGQYHDISTWGNIMECDVCGYLTCAFHNMPADHYKNQTCEEFGADVNPYDLSGAALAKYQQEMSESTIKGVSKRCPKCSVIIERDGGCDSMRCYNCKARFSWSKDGKEL